MSKFNEILVAALLPAIKSVGTLEVEAALDSIKQHNTPELFETTLKSMHGDFLLLREAVLKTNTKVDDGIVDLFIAAIEGSAADSNIQLT